MRPSRIAMLGIVMGLLSATAHAQVQLKARMETSTLLPYEPAYLVLSFTNTGGAPIIIRDQDSAFRFKLTLKRDDGVRVNSKDIPIIRDRMVLAGNSTREFRLNLLKVFEIYEQGAYTVTAMVIQNGKIGVTAKNFFDIVPGVEVNRYLSGRPVRVFILRTLNRDNRNRLLVHIEDEKARAIYGVYDLGSWMRGNLPEVRTDAGNNLHLLHRASPTQFNHNIFTAQGRPVKTEFYRSRFGGLPHLQPTPGGGMEVVGAEQVELTGPDGFNRAHPGPP